ncbi:MAG: hypothetical protein R3D46_00905 [Defluviimonas denitrificans]
MIVWVTDLILPGFCGSLEVLSRIDSGDAMSERVAIFVDGENISAGHAAAIRKIAAGHGVVDTARVYGNALTQPKWDTNPVSASSTPASARTRRTSC